MTGVDTTWLIDLEITDSPRHEGALQLFEKWRSQKNSMLAIYYQSFLEFQHVVTDSKRFNSPLTMEQALERCWFWIAQERIKIIYPGETSLKRSQLWMSMYKLGRKHIQDTHMAAAFLESCVTQIFTANPADFEIFEAFDLVNY